MPSQSSADEIAKLHRLLTDNIISQQEFETMKRRIIEESLHPNPVKAHPAPMYDNQIATRASLSGAVSDGRRTWGGWLKHLFTGRGRIGRKEYVLTWIGTSVIQFVGWTLYYSLLEMSAPAGVEMTTFGDSLMLLAAVLVLVSFWISICAAVKRYHDLSKSGAWVILLIVPFVGFLLFLMLIFGDGTEGANMYGTRPGHTDTSMYIPPAPAYEALPDRRNIVSW